jgi:TFIIF-interacting CTD phosphatase-like protein
MKKNVILDLDNTILSAEPLDEFPFKKPGLKKRICGEMAVHDMDSYYIIFERPRVQNFLDWLFENYNVSVWTAASKDYALYVIENIILTKPERKLDHILFSYHCNISKKQYRYSKKLNLIFDRFQIPNYNSDNTIIIDDLPEVSSCQPDNAIRIKAFEILDEGSENDREMENIIPQIKSKFKNLEK